MTRSVLFLVCITIVAAFQAPFAAAVAVSEDVPIPGGIDSLAAVLGIQPIPERGRFISEVTRLVYDSEARNPSAAAFLQEVRLKALADAQRAADPLRAFNRPPDGTIVFGRSSESARPHAGAAGSRGTDGARAFSLASLHGPDVSRDFVPLPLSHDIWNNAVFHRKVDLDELVVMILADRQATLLCYGLSGLDDETLQFFAEHTGLLSRIHERSAPIFAAFASSIHVHANRVVPVGGADAVPLWEAALGEKVTRAERFVLALLETNDGRMAYLYDIAARLDPPRRAFVLGSWMTNPAERLARFKTLATSGLGAFRDWHVRATPFGRAPTDVGMVLSRVRAADDGAPLGPANRAFWSRVFASDELPAVNDEAGARFKAFEDDGSGTIDAAWLTETIGSADVRQRAERLDQFSFGQRVFAGSRPEDLSHALVAVRAVPRYRALMLTLERIGIRTPALYAAAARYANQLAAVDGRRGFVAQAQFQGALALVSRMALVRTLDVPTAEAMIERLIAVPVREDGRYAGGVSRWLQQDVLSRLKPATTLESTLIAGLSGPASADESADAPIAWEGQQYRLDLGFAERHRLERVRRKQEAVPLDVPLNIARMARELSSESVSAADIESAVAKLTTLARAVPRVMRSESAAAPGGAGFADAHDALRKATEDLARAAKARDVKRSSRVAESLIEVSDDLLAQALLSFAYALSVGDPDGTVLLAGDVSYRHDFGFGLKDNTLRARATWSLPRQEVAPNTPWHVTGSLLGLDLGLAPLALRRMSFERAMRAPKLTSTERETFAATVALMSAYGLGDADRDAIVDAIARGRARVAALSETSGMGDRFDAIADEVQMDGWRRRTVRWMLANEPASVTSMFSMTELLFLGGGGSLAALDSWGMSAVATRGCLCAHMVQPAMQWSLAGRPQLGIVSAGVPDLTLHVATVLKQLQVPAALAKTVLSAAVQDFIDDVQPSDEGDWLTLSRTAQTLTREQVEDYLAAATADGPLVPLPIKSSQPGVPREE